jgi:hypothetical protein
MRDVTDSAKGSSEQLKQDILQMFHFLRHPIDEVTKLPGWSIKRSLLWTGACAMASGVLSGLLIANPFRVAQGLVLTPIVLVTMNVIMALFLYYLFQIFEKRTVEFTKLVELNFFTNLPFFAFQVPSDLVPAFTILGFVFTGLLMIVGLVENFKVDRKRAIQLVVFIEVIVFVIWAWNRLSAYRG